MRHSWLSDGRQEDVAEHTWRMALMALLLHSYLDQKVDLLKALKIILVHDLVEINYKDSPAFKKQPLDKASRERAVSLKLLEVVCTETGSQFLFSIPTFLSQRY
jgi:putative hydrolases of HD superfamily